MANIAIGDSVIVKDDDESSPVPACHIQRRPGKSQMLSF